jgi:hypothetical protein
VPPHAQVLPRPRAKRGVETSTVKMRIKVARQIGAEKTLWLGWSHCSLGFSRCAQTPAEQVLCSKHPGRVLHRKLPRRLRRCYFISRRACHHQQRDQQRCCHRGRRWRRLQQRDITQMMRCSDVMQMLVHYFQHLVVWEPMACNLANLTISLPLDCLLCVSCNNLWTF